MRKSKIRTLIILLVFTLGLSYYIYYGFTKAPSRLRTNYQTITSDTIPKDINGMQIAFISDMHFQEFFDQARLANLSSKMQTLNPDVIIFTGDLIARELSEEELTLLTKELRGMQAKFGKFAVLGEGDYASDEINDQVEQIFYNSDFEIIRNSAIHLTKGSQEYINIVGIDSLLDNHADIDKAYADLDSKVFTITAVHTPDIIKDLPNHTNLVIAGHSHGGQVKIPLLGQIYNKPEAELYYSGKHNVRGIQLHINNGLGTSQTDVRINAPAEILVYTLRNK